MRQAENAAWVLGGAIVGDFPLLDGVRVLADEQVELLLNNSWRPALAVTGQDGMPSVEKAGNVLLPHLTWKLSLRLPPTLEADKAAATVKRVSRRSAVWSPRHGHGPWDDGLERSTTGAVARRGDGSEFARVLRQGGLLSWPGRLDSFHVHARRALSTGAVSHHRGARSACQCPWAK